jgi:hypothetical protein
MSVILEMRRLLGESVGKTKTADSLRKGDKISVDGVVVVVVKRDKMSTKNVRITLADCGNGLPSVSAAVKDVWGTETSRYFGVKDQVQVELPIKVSKAQVTRARDLGLIDSETMFLALGDQGPAEAQERARKIVLDKLRGM